MARTLEEVESVLADLGVFDGDMTKRERQAFPEMLRHWIGSARRFKMGVSITQSLMNGGVVGAVMYVVQNHPH